MILLTDQYLPSVPELRNVLEDSCKIICFIKTIVVHAANDHFFYFLNVFFYLCKIKISFKRDNFYFRYKKELI